MIKKTYEYLTGRYHPDLVPCQHSEGKLIHHEMVNHLNDLYKELKKFGFELTIHSGYRNHLDQLRIWNDKVEGRRPLLDSNGDLLDVNVMADEEIVKSICRWSAIPGASRHHWGTDIDIYCKNSLPSSDYTVELTQQEVSNQGPFGKFHQKLDELLENSSFFYRPYQNDNGGVSPERWHLSYYPLADELLEKFTIEAFEQNINETDIHLKEVILHDLEYFFKNYVLNITPSPKNT